MSRPSHTYRGARRNAWFGRPAIGNTKPADRRRRWLDRAEMPASGGVTRVRWTGEHQIIHRKGPRGSIKPHQGKRECTRRLRRQA